MKILHITASYKPAYIYGGPIMSVAKLCEELQAFRKVESGKLKAESRKQKAEIGKQKAESVSARVLQLHNNGAQPPFSKPPTSLQITVYTTLANGTEELPYQNGTIKIVDGVPVHYFKRLTKDHSHFSPALLLQLWKTVRHFDVVHIHAWWNLVSMPACLMALFRGVKVVLTPRGTLSTYSFRVNNSAIKKLFHQLIGRPLLNQTYFHCTSQKELEDTQLILKPKRLFNIPNFVDLPWAREFKGAAKSADLRLLFFSRIEQKKGLELLLESLEHRGLNFQLAIAGNGEPNYIAHLKKLVSEKKLTDRITWLGPVYGEQKFELMAAYDYLILPSFDENFANVVIESLYAGTPVLVSENVGLADYVQCKNLGLVFKRNKLALQQALKDSALAKEAQVYDGSRLRQEIRNDFIETRLTARYIDLYKEVINLDRKPHLTGYE